jgi:hypothetical protein
MPIPVVCPGCKSRFSVSDQFAGRTGPCPKCKQPITIPKPAAASVVIHEPEAPVSTSAGTGRAPTAPLKKRDRPVPVSAFLATGGGAVTFMIAAFALRWIYPKSGSGEAAESTIPIWILALGAFAAALPSVILGYAAVRNRELEAFRGRPLLIRSLICSVVYAGLWGARWVLVSQGVLPADGTSEIFPWLYVGPLFVAAGSLAALATLDLDWGTAAVHFSFYVLFAALLRSLAGLSPL